MLCGKEELAVHQRHRAFAWGLHLISFGLQVAEWVGLGGPALCLEQHLETLCSDSSILSAASVIWAGIYW